LNTATEIPPLKSFYFDFKQITKAGLSVSVVFSSIAGYFLGIFDFASLDWVVLLTLAIGGYCMVGASNTFNQIIEKDLDLLMDRTKNRPIAAGRISVTKAFIIASILTLAGLIILYNINPKTAMFGAISIFLYTSVYTPLKTVTPLSVFVGAIPGAIPFMLGWVAATDDFSLEAGTLFMIQFLWQFPHFWAIAWVLDDDYKKAGFKMLPSGNRDKASAFQAFVYASSLIPICLIPYYFHISGSISAIACVIISIGFAYQSFVLFKTCDMKAARSLMFASFLYLPLVQIILVLDKI
jgi:protoheme IX farnesyltransferase